MTTESSNVEWAETRGQTDRERLGFWPDGRQLSESLELVSGHISILGLCIRESLRIHSGHQVWLSAGAVIILYKGESRNPPEACDPVRGFF